MGACRFASITTLLLSSLIMAGCGGGDSDSTPPTSATAVWSFSGVYGGYIPNIVYHPTTSCEVWASADDMGGIYKSTDCGVNWTRVSTPKNFSTYSLTFDPNNSSVMYAPSHFGWGMLKSANGGSSWSLSQAGLPSTGTTKHVYQIAVNPTDSTIIVAATENGLYRSTDSGATFTNLSLAWGTKFTAAIYVGGRLLAGAGALNGVVKYSDDDGDTWNDLLPGAGGTAPPVAALVTSANAIYYLFTDGSLLYTSFDFLTSGTLNDSTSTTPPSPGISSGAVRPTLAVVSGPTQASDIIYLGTSRNSTVATSRWGLFKSTNGGGSWVQQLSGVTGHSIFSIAIDPGNMQSVLVGSSDSAGIFRTDNGGTTWTSSSTGMQSNVGFGFAQNPLNANELVMSSTVGYGLGKTWHSTNLGSSWSEVAEVNTDDGVLTMDFDPVNSDTMLAGMISTGLYQSTNGIAGPWNRVIMTNVKISRIIRDNSNPAIVYALAAMSGSTLDPAERVYYSNNYGTSFSIRSLFFALDLAPHPTIANEAVIAGVDDAYVSTNGFSTANSLGMTAEATAQNGLTAIAFNPANAKEVWVGGNSGGLYRTVNYKNSGAGVIWIPVTSPVSNAMVRQIMIRTENSVKTIYVSSFASDVYFTPGAVLGLWKSTNDGATWTELSSSLSPCTAFWGFYPVAGSTTDLWAGLWGGGGLFKMTYQ